MVSEQRVLLISNLDRWSSILPSRQQTLSMKFHPFQYVITIHAQVRPFSSSTPLSLSNLPQPQRRIKTHLRNQNLIPHSHRTANPLPILVQSTGSNSQHPRFIQFLHTALRKEDTRCSLGFRFDALDQDAIEEGREGFDATMFRVGCIRGCGKSALFRVHCLELWRWYERKYTHTVKLTLFFFSRCANKGWFRLSG